MGLPKMLSIAQLTEMYQENSLTPEDVIEEIIKRSEESRSYHTWITPPSMELIRPYLEQLKEMDPSEKPLWGIPFAIKDNIDLAGVPTTSGCAEFAYIPEKHATVVKRLIEAGAIPVGKANLDQFATGLVGTRSPYGETKNALKKELISGGSSSGSAVAVALGLAAFALGTDTAGSGRVPAALNRLVGFKPSVGAWPINGLVKACASIDCITVFANHVQEALIIDAIVRGKDDEDSWSKTVIRKPSERPKKIYFVQEEPLFFGRFEKEYQRAWQSTKKRIEQMGIAVEKLDGRFLKEAAAILYEGPWVAERWAELGAFITAHADSAHPVTEKVLRSATDPKHDATSVFKAMHKLQQFKAKVRQQLKDGVLIMPTAGGTWSREEVRENPIDTNRDMGMYTNHCNLLDLCAIAVPGEDAADDLPFGITFFSTSENEHFVSGLAGLFLEEEEVCAPTCRGADTTLVAVCGLHMRGYPLEKQMVEHQAVFVREARTAGKYRLVKLPTSPAKPGLIRVNEGGVSVEVELWEMPVVELGSFVASIPAPLGFGKVELEDGVEVTGFICESSARDKAKDISYTGGWRYDGHTSHTLNR